MSNNTINQILETKNNSIVNAVSLAVAYGSTDGGHHKAWVIDQMVRALAGNGKRYKAIVAYAKLGEDGPDTYEWDEGISP